jgi:cell fate (sporulation/competence/biofilm development) regulator YmcA (YheA/YmcA/DUF963 family)
MIQGKIDKLRSKLQTTEQVKLLNQLEKEIKRVQKIQNKYAEAMAHIWDGMDINKAFDEVGITKNGTWI